MSDPIPLYVQDRITRKHEGFPKVDYRTSLRAGKGPSGALLFTLVGVAMAVGFGLNGISQNRKMYDTVSSSYIKTTHSLCSCRISELDKKKKQLVLAPLLQAEEDRKYGIYLSVGVRLHSQ